MFKKEDCKSGGHRSHGHPKHKSDGHKKSDCRSDKSKGSKEKDCRKNDHAHCILSKIGVGTENVRIYFDGAVLTGVFLGFVNGCVALNVKGVVNYINIDFITAVAVGIVVNKKKRTKCRKPYVVRVYKR